jgi:hypothetical protein
VSYLLFLDDVRHPDQVTWERFPRDLVTFILRDYDSFVAQIKLSGIPAFVCFDHDLADQHYEAMLAESEGRQIDYGNEKTGFDAAKWLVEYCHQNGRKFPKYVVHSMNPAGKERIISYIENARKHLEI